MFNNENNYTEKETKKIIELSNRVFEHVGNQCGLRKLTYETYLGLPENDTRRKNVDNYLKKGFENIEEIGFLNLKNRVETLNNNLSNKDKVHDFDSFIELNEKITGKKTKEEPKVETNKTNINTNTSDIDDLFMENKEEVKVTKKGLFQRIKDTFTDGFSTVKNNKIVESLGKNIGKSGNKLGRFVKKLKSPLQSFIWALNFMGISVSVLFVALAIFTGAGLGFLAPLLSLLLALPAATLAYNVIKLVVKKMKDKKLTNKSPKEEVEKMIKEELKDEKESEKTEEKVGELDLDAIEKDGLSQEVTEKQSTEEKFENEEEVAHDEEVADNLNKEELTENNLEEERIQPILETNSLSTPKQNDTAAIREFRNKIQVLANNKKRYERSLEFINNEIENEKRLLGLSHKELYNKKVNPTYVRRVNQRNEVNKMINECDKAISQYAEIINRELSIDGLTHGEHSNLEIEQMIAALNQIKEKQTAAASSVEKIEEYESRMR